MKKPILSLLFLFCSLLSFAGNDNFSLGGRQTGLGYTGLTLTDLWSTQHNQANLAFLNSYSFGAYYENKFGLKETALKSFVGAVPLGKAGTFGIVANQFGFTNYTEAKYGLAYGRKLAENFSMGVQINYHSLRFGDIYGTRSSITAEIGLRARLIEKLTFAAHVYNVSRTKLHEYDAEYIPTIIRFGLEYKFSEAVFALAESETSINANTNIKCGVEYNIKQKIYLRMGVNSNPFIGSFGVGYKYKMISVDVGSAYHQVLGFSPAVSLHVDFVKKKYETQPIQ